MNNLSTKNLKILILIGVFAIQGIAIGATPKTVDQLLRNVNQKSIKKTKTLIKADNKREKQTRSLQPRNIMPTSSDFRINTTGADAVSEKHLNAQIKIMSGLVNKHKRSKARGELWLRLAELYTQKANYLDKGIQTKFDRALEKWEANHRRGPRPMLNTKPAHRYNNRSIKLCEAFLSQFPKDQKVDRVLYFLGLNYQELGQGPKAAKYFNQLKTKHKNSPYIGLASFILATHYFDNRKWKPAKKNYLAVMRNKNIPSALQQDIVPNAIYKYAWSDLQMDNADKAASNFERIYRLSRSEGSFKGYKRLQKAVLADIVQTYNRTKKTPRQAEQYLIGTLEIDEKELSKYLKAIAYQYSDEGNLSGANFIFRRLIQLNPISEDALIYQEEIVKLYRHTNKKAFLVELNRYIKDFSKGSPWYKSNLNKKEIIAQANKTRESLLRNYILNNHQLFQKSGTQSSKRAILSAYPIYLKEFLNNKEAPTMRFYYAELMYDLKNYDKAMKHYMWIVEKGANSKHYNTALLNALLATDEALKKKNKNEKRSGSLKKVAYSRLEKNFIALATKYINIEKDGENNAEINMKVARLHYLKNHFKRAEKSFWGIITRYPNSEQATYSANLILDIYNLKKDYKGLAEAGKKLLKYETLIARSGAGKSEVRDIKAIVSNAEFTNIQEMEKKGDSLAAAKGYVKFANQTKDISLKQKALFNAAINFEKANDILKAITHQELYLKANKNNKDESVKRSIRILANLYEQTGMIKKAAVEFEKYAKAYPTDQYADESILNAARIFRAFKNFPKALSNYRVYRNKTKSKATKDEILLEIAQTKEEMNNTKDAYTDYSNYVASNPSDGPMLMASMLKLFRMAQKSRRADVKKWRDKIISVQRSLGGNIGITEAAEARFHVATGMFEEFKKTKIPADPAKQLNAITKLSDQLNKLDRELAKVIKYDDGNYVVHSVALIAQASEHFIKTIEAIPVPKILKEKKQIEEYKKGVEEKYIVPVRTKAISNYELAIEKAFEIPAYNESVTKSFERLAQLKSDGYSFMTEKVMPTEKLDIYGLDNKAKDKKPYEGLSLALKSRDLELAIQEASKILSKKPDDAIVYNTLAVVALNRGYNYLARLYLGKIKDSDMLPETTKRNNLAMVLLKDKEINRAFSEFYGSALDNDNPVASANASSVLLKYQNFETATPYLRIAAKAFSKDPAILNNYAIALKYAGNSKRANAIYKRALEYSSSEKAGWIKLNHARLMSNNSENKVQAQKTLNDIAFNEDDTELVAEAKSLLRKIK